MLHVITCGFALSKFLFLNYHLCSIHLLTFSVCIASGLNASADYNTDSLMKIFFCKLCPRPNTTQLIKSADASPSLRNRLSTASVYLAIARAFSPAEYLTSGSLVKLTPLKLLCSFFYLFLSVSERVLMVLSKIHV